VERRRAELPVACDTWQHLDPATPNDALAIADGVARAA
jgi:hypothetical protein